MSREFCLKVLMSVSIFFLFCSFAYAQEHGGAIRFTKLETGRITLEGCGEKPNGTITCLGLGNPRGYTQDDLISLSGTSNKVGSFVLGTSEAAVIIIGYAFALPVAASSGAWGTPAAAICLLLPTGAVILVNKTINFLNPARQWRKGNIKELLSEHGLGTSAVIFNSEKDYARAVEITVEVLKKLPSNDTY